MQTTLDIPLDQLSQLDKLSRDRQVPRDEIVRTAISTYIEGQEIASEPAHVPAEALDSSFGVWAFVQGDGVDYQQRMRAEW